MAVEQREAKAILRYSRIAPSKVRLVTRLIQDKPVEAALYTLRFLNKRGARIVEKVLRSAMSNAQQKRIGDLDELWVRRAVVDGGPFLKRWYPRAMGRTAMIRRRTSHITLVVSASRRRG